MNYRRRRYGRIVGRRARFITSSTDVSISTSWFNCADFRQVVLSRTNCRTKCRIDWLIIHIRTQMLDGKVLQNIRTSSSMTMNELLGRGNAARDNETTASLGVPSGEVQCWLVHKSPPSRLTEGDTNSPGIEMSQYSTGFRRRFYFQDKFDFRRPFGSTSHFTIGIISNIQNASLAPAVGAYSLSYIWKLISGIIAFLP